MSPQEAHEHFVEALIAAMPKTVEPDQIEKFDADFRAVGGMPNRRPFSKLSGFSRFHALGLSFLGARSALQALPRTRKRIASIRSLKLSDRMELARLSSWHCRYVLRERLRNLFDLFKEAENGPAPELSKIAAAYKKATDKELAPRHRGVHEYDHHDPLVRQVEIHELLTLRPLPAGPLRDSMESERKRVERHAKHTILSTLATEEERLLEMTDAAFSDAYQLRPIWRFSA